MQARGIKVDTATFNGAGDRLIDRLLGYEIARYSFGERGEWAAALGGRSDGRRRLADRRRSKDAGGPAGARRRGEAGRPLTLRAWSDRRP